MYEKSGKCSSLGDVFRLVVLSDQPSKPKDIQITFM